MDGYTRLLHKIFGIVEPPVCRVCGTGIEQSIKGRCGGRICRSCYRGKNNETQRLYYSRHPDRVQASIKRWGLRHPEALRAHAMAHYLYPETQVCSVEGCSKLAHRHHDDYSKPAEIEWLCALHHKELSKV